MTVGLGFLIAALALLVGFAMGRFQVGEDRSVKKAARHGRAYMRSVLHLLSRDRDAAAEELKAVVREGVSDIEPYFALGSLFRARGEWERAVRVHQAIELRENANPKLALRARYELGLDFRAAKMPRRGIRAMEGCLRDDPNHEGALRALAGLYEKTGRFAEAALAWRRLSAFADSSPVREAHLWAAAAERAVRDADTDLASRALRELQNQKTDNSAAVGHAAIAQAAVLQSQGNNELACAVLRDLLSTKPEIAQVTIARLRSMYLADTEPTEYGLAETVSRRLVDDLAVAMSCSDEPGHLALCRAELIAEFDAKASSSEFAGVAEAEPEILPARIWAARTALASGEQAAITRELAAMAGEGGALAWAMAVIWRCGHCGHRVEQHFWKCDECTRWGTARRDIGLAAYDRPTDPPRERRSRKRQSRSPLLGEFTPDRADDSVMEKAGTFISGVWKTVRGSPNQGETLD